MDKSDIEAVTDHLRSLGCNEIEIDRTIDQLMKYDQQMIHESVFDSIASGSFHLNALIEKGNPTLDSAGQSVQS